VEVNCFAAAVTLANTSSAKGNRGVLAKTTTKLDDGWLADDPPTTSHKPVSEDFFWGLCGSRL